MGKSTLACATAVRAARDGEQVLIVSTDQAHSLGDVLGVDVPPGGPDAAVRVLDGEFDGPLDALALDTLALLEQGWGSAAEVVAQRYPDSEIGDLAPEELSALPGIQEVLGLHTVAELADSGRWDLVVVDCASTADALRMLTLPGAFGLYLERAWPQHRRLSSVTDRSGAAVVTLLERMAAGMDGLSALLGRGDRVGAHLVLTPEKVVAAEAVRTLGALSLMGVRVDRLIVNQVLLQDDSYEYSNLPEHPAFDWYAARINEQQRVLAELSATIGDVELALAPHFPGEPIGAASLGELLDAVVYRNGAAPPGPLRPVIDLESGSGLGSIYRMRLELPQVDSGSLTLGRVDDDLVIGTGGLRRRVRLASVLRRCTVVDAALRGTELTVRFRPNPEVWPA